MHWQSQFHSFIGLIIERTYILVGFIMKLKLDTGIQIRDSRIILRYVLKFKTFLYFTRFEVYLVVDIKNLLVKHFLNYLAIISDWVHSMLCCVINYLRKPKIKFIRLIYETSRHRKKRWIEKYFLNVIFCTE